MSKKKPAKRGKQSKSSGGASVVPHPLQNVPEVLETQVAQKAYKDALAKPLKAAGDVATDLIKTVGAFTSTLRMGAEYFPRLVKMLSGVSKRVPKERQVEPPPEIAGPIIRHLQFVSDDNPLRSLFLNLLTTSIDSEKRELLHPAFPMILSQLSGAEAQVISRFTYGENVSFWWSSFRDDVLASYRPFKYTDNYPPMFGTPEEPRFELPINTPRFTGMYLERLSAFQLLRRVNGGEPFAEQRWEAYSLQEFGNLFLSACDVQPTMLKTDREISTPVVSNDKTRHADNSDKNPS